MTTPRTSLTHPLRVDFVATPAPGRLGMTFGPGKVQPHAATGSWRRDLRQDLTRIRDHFGANRLVSIIEEHELVALHIADLGDVASELGLGWRQLAVVDGGVPSDLFAWTAAVREVAADLRRGRTTVVHCKGGLGRTGMFAAAVLVALGASPISAIGDVRKARPGTIENARQERAVHDTPDRLSTHAARQLRGCLLAGAAGDALGAPVEFRSLAAIRRQHGERGVREMVAGSWPAGSVTDDTQMALFCAEGLLRAWARMEDKGVYSAPDMLECAYLRWLWTQGVPVPAALRSVADGELWGEPRLRVRRAPGNTCLSALHTRLAARVAGEFLEGPLNDSKGCGTVMRAAPIGLVGRRMTDDLFRFGGVDAVLTHGHPAAADASGLLAVMLDAILQGTSLADAVAEAWHDHRARCCADTVGVMDAALALVGRGRPPSAEELETLGGGWVAEEALAIAVVCALTASGVEDGLSRAVSHSGDSDSTGAIAGYLLGATLGEDAIPKRWRDTLDVGDVVERVADGLGRMRVTKGVRCSSFASKTPGKRRKTNT